MCFKENKWHIKKKLWESGEEKQFVVIFAYASMNAFFGGSEIPREGSMVG
jgi:hypothetical protein